MPRRRPEPRRRPSLPPTFQRRLETGPDGFEYEVKAVPGSRAVKTYRCPGCDHEVRPGTPHVVVWPADHGGEVDDRRHWHTPCWTNRGNRGPTRRWS
ncbi:hypothetical protein [Mycolicibacterium sediminis]|uniref:hypothetical protein n=1 Tax=Mycolicibacterium sediminis TaxID=1286180 RepID=UPI0013D0923D|nr:hypothetical protein [Mycolicibacterium sediminis]